MHSKTLSLAGRADTPYSDQSAKDKCRLGYVDRLTGSSLRGPRHILRWASKFTRKLVRSSPRGEVYAFSEMMTTRPPYANSMGILRLCPMV